MNNQLPFIDVAGDPYTRGVQIGQASKRQIAHSLSVYRQTFELCDISWQQALSMASNYQTLIESSYPDLYEELNGMAIGSGFDMADLFTLNCRTEILPPDFLARALVSKLVSKNETFSSADVDASECTSFAFNRGSSKPVWLAQNWDWIGLQREALIVVRAKNERGEQFITVTEAGMLAKIGLNQNGFGVCLNILRSVDDGDKPGLPVHFLLRVLLDCETVEQAAALVSATQFASSSNVMIADQSGAMANLELSPHGVQVLAADDNTLCHTNHFLHTALVANEAKQAAALSSVARLHTAQSNLPSLHNLNDIQSLLSDTSNGQESICRFANENLPPIAQIETVAGVVMNLSNMELWVSDAQPSASEFRHYTF